jgi:hypothetical protein
MICVWTDQCGPACFPCVALATSNPQFALHYHDELDTVMTMLFVDADLFSAA